MQETSNKRGQSVQDTNVLPVCAIGAAVSVTELGLLTVTAGFFRTTSEPNAPLPPSVPTLLSQLSTLAFFAPPAEAPCRKDEENTAQSFLVSNT